MTSREKFEAWAKDNGMSLVYGDCDYVYSPTVWAWKAWQAAEADMAVQLANADSKCRELEVEISRRDEIFVPVYPDENTMNRMTDVFHDTAKIHCDEDSIFVDNAELVITAIINHYIKSDDAFLAEVRARAIPSDVMAAIQKVARIRIDLNDFDGDKRGIVDCLGEAEESLIEVVNKFAAQLRKGGAA